MSNPKVPAAAEGMSANQYARLIRELAEAWETATPEAREAALTYARQPAGLKLAEGAQ